MTSFVSTVLVLVLTLGVGVAQAAPAAVPADLAEKVAERIGGDWGVDPARLSLEWGHVPGAMTASGASLLRMVGRGVDGWMAAVIQPESGRAMSVRVRAGTTDSVWVASRALAPGTTLAAEDLRIAARVHWGPPRSATHRPGPGWEVRRPLAVGDELAPPATSPPALVTAGDPVRLEWSRGGVIIALTGTAMNSARQGDTVRARVPGRQNPVAGIVTAPGLATLLRGGRP